MCRHDMTETLLKAAQNTIQSINQLYNVPTFRSVYENAFNLDKSLTQLFG